MFVDLTTLPTLCLKSDYLAWFREASRIDFVREKRHMDVDWWWGEGGLAPVTFLGEKSLKISIVS